MNNSDTKNQTSASGSFEVPLSPEFVEGLGETKPVSSPPVPEDDTRPSVEGRYPGGVATKSSAFRPVLLFLWKLADVFTVPLLGLAGLAYAWYFQSVRMTVVLFFAYVILQRLQMNMFAKIIDARFQEFDRLMLLSNMVISRSLQNVLKVAQLGVDGVSALGQSLGLIKPGIQFDKLPKQ